MLTREVASERRARPDVLRPVDAPRGSVELFGGADVPLAQHEEHAIRSARAEARAIRHFERAAERTPVDRSRTSSAPNACSSRARRSARPRGELATNWSGSVLTPHPHSPAAHRALAASWACARARSSRALCRSPHAPAARADHTRTATAPAHPAARDGAASIAQPVILDHHVEIVPRHLADRARRESRTVQATRFDSCDAGARELRAQETEVEARVVRDEQPPVEPPRQLARRCPRRTARRATISSVMPVKCWMPCGIGQSGIHERAPLVLQLPVVRGDQTDLDDAVTAGVAARRFDVDERHRPFEQRLAVVAHDRSIQVVFSSVYLSNACSDLSRPMPDCLKPPNGTVMSSAS